jgi:hypothetical protein
MSTFIHRGLEDIMFCISEYNPNSECRGEEHVDKNINIYFSVYLMKYWKLAS